MVTADAVYRLYRTLCFRTSPDHDNLAHCID